MRGKKQPTNQNTSFCGVTALDGLSEEPSSQGFWTPGAGCIWTVLNPCSSSLGLSTNVDPFNALSGDTECALKLPGPFTVFLAVPCPPAATAAFSELVAGSRERCWFLLWRLQGEKLRERCRPSLKNNHSLLPEKAQAIHRL